MNKFLTALILFGAAGFASAVSAQTFMQRPQLQKPATESVTSAETPAVAAQTEEEISPEELAAIENRLNAQVTPAEKVEMQAPIRKANKITARNMRPEEARRMVDALNALEKIKARRAGLVGDAGSIQKNEQIKINVYDSKAIEELLNRQILEDSAETAQESEQAPRQQEIR